MDPVWQAAAACPGLAVTRRNRLGGYAPVCAGDAECDRIWAACLLAQALEAGQDFVADIGQKTQELGSVYTADLVRGRRGQSEIAEARPSRAREMMPPDGKPVGFAAKLKLLDRYRRYDRASEIPPTIELVMSGREFGAMRSAHPDLWKERAVYGGPPSLAAATSAAAKALREVAAQSGPHRGGREYGRPAATIAALRTRTRQRRCASQRRAIPPIRRRGRALHHPRSKAERRWPGEASAIGKSNAERELRDRSRQGRGSRERARTALTQRSGRRSSRRRCAYAAQETDRRRQRRQAEAAGSAAGLRRHGHRAVDDLIVELRN